MENGDAKPTNGAYKVFEELSNELQGHLNKLDGILKSDFVRLNQMLSEKNLDKIAVAEK